MQPFPSLYTSANRHSMLCLSPALVLRLNNTYTAFAILPRNPLTALLHNRPLQFILTYSQSPFLVESPALNLNCLFCPFPLSSSLLSGVREGDRPWALNYPCSTLALKPYEAVWVDWFYECDDGLTCRNPLSLISPRPSAPSPSLFPLLSLSPLRLSIQTHTYTYTRM